MEILFAFGRNYRFITIQLLGFTEYVLVGAVWMLVFAGDLSNICIYRYRDCDVHI